MSLIPASMFFKGLNIYGLETEDFVFVTFDLILSENHNFDSEVTTHPVEDGSEISDHIQNELVKGDITGLITNYSVNTPFLITNRAQDVFNTLVGLWEDKKLFTLYTVLNIYENVAITSMPITLDETMSDSLVFQISFREVKVVQLQEIVVDVLTNQNRQIAKVYNAGRGVPL